MLNCWNLMYHQSRNISCDEGTKKFFNLDIKKLIYLKRIFFLCILHRLFLLGTFFRWLFVLGTVFLIRTGDEFLKM